MNFIYVIECECIPEIDRFSKPVKRLRKSNTISFFSVIILLETCKNLNLINIPEFWVSSSHSRPCFASDFGLHSCDLEWVQYHSTLCDLECIKFFIEKSMLKWELNNGNRFLPVCTKFVGCPIIDRSILMRWWRWRRRVGLCGWWKQHVNHCTQISPVLAISFDFIQIHTHQAIKLAFYLKVYNEVRLSGNGMKKNGRN